MADTPNCPNCGKALVQVAPLGGTTMKSFCCDCAEAEPTLADVLAALRALHEICEGHAKLLLALTEGGFPVVTRDMLVHVHEGEGVWPRKYPEPIGVDEVGQPIFPEAGTPEEGQPPSAQSGDAAPQ